MYFQVLQLRLIALLKGRVRNGEITERRLALLTGVSQPHIHNVLKGARMLSPEVADQILECLRLSIFDLVQKEEIPAHPEAARAAPLPYEEIPILEGRVGPGFPYPNRVSHVEHLPFLRSQLASAQDPVVARGGSDPHMTALFASNDLALLDRAESQRSRPKSGQIFVIQLDGVVAVRRLHTEDGWLLASTADGIVQPLCPFPPPAAGRDMLEKVLARVLWIGRDLERVESAGEADQETGGADRSAGRKG
jgi:transcriptional regulator with XRE-family HTH domain